MPRHLSGEENQFIPVINDIHSLILPDQTRIVVSLDGPCNAVTSDSDSSRIVLPGSLYLPIEDSMKFDRGPLRGIHIITPPDELFTTYIDLKTTPGSVFRLTRRPDINRIIIDIYGSSNGRPEEIDDKKFADLQREADKEFREHTFENRGNDLDLRLRRIVIDPGHGGYDPGAVGLRGTKEKDITLKLALRLADTLNSRRNLSVHLTRSADYYLNLSDRTATANQYRADLFLSIHCNAAENRDARGSETYFCSETASDAEAARVAQFENSFADDEDLNTAESLVDIEFALFRLRRKLLWNDSGSLAKLIQEKIVASEVRISLFSEKRLCRQCS